MPFFLVHLARIGSAHSRLEMYFRNSDIAQVGMQKSISESLQEAEVERKQGAEKMKKVLSVCEET